MTTMAPSFLVGGAIEWSSEAKERQKEQDIEDESKEASADVLAYSVARQRHSGCCTVENSWILYPPNMSLNRSLLGSLQETGNDTVIARS